MPLKVSAVYLRHYKRDRRIHTECRAVVDYERTTFHGFRGECTANLSADRYKCDVYAFKGVKASALSFFYDAVVAQGRDRVDRSTAAWIGVAAPVRMSGFGARTLVPFLA